MGIPVVIFTRAARETACKKVGRPWAILMRFVVLVSPCRQTPVQYDRLLSHSFRFIIHRSSHHSFNPAEQVSFLNSEVMLRSPFFWKEGPRRWVIHTRRFETASQESKVSWTTWSRNVGHQPPSDAAPHPRRTTSTERVVNKRINKIDYPPIFVSTPNSISGHLLPSNTPAIISNWAANEPQDNSISPYGYCIYFRVTLPKL